MQQFASLRQKAREGDLENAALLQLLQGQAGPTPETISDWDLSLADVASRYGTLTPRPKGRPRDADQDELTYYKAVAASKRGSDALVDRVVQKSEKQLKAQDREAKRQRREQPRELHGFALSERNQKFNDRL